MRLWRTIVRVKRTVVKACAARNERTTLQRLPEIRVVEPNLKAAGTEGTYCTWADSAPGRAAPFQRAHAPARRNLPSPAKTLKQKGKRPRRHKSRESRHLCVTAANCRGAPPRTRTLDPLIKSRPASSRNALQKKDLCASAETPSAPFRRAGETAETVPQNVA